MKTDRCDQCGKFVAWRRGVQSEPGVWRHRDCANRAIWKAIDEQRERDNREKEWADLNERIDRLLGKDP